MPRDKTGGVFIFIICWKCTCLFYKNEVEAAVPIDIVTEKSGHTYRPIIMFIPDKKPIISRRSKHRPKSHNYALNKTQYNYHEKGPKSNNRKRGPKYNHTDNWKGPKHMYHDGEGPKNYNYPYDYDAGPKYGSHYNNCKGPKYKYPYDYDAGPKYGHYYENWKGPKYNYPYDYDTGPKYGHHYENWKGPKYNYPYDYDTGPKYGHHYENWKGPKYNYPYDYDTGPKYGHHYENWKGPKYNYPYDYDTGHKYGYNYDHWKGPKYSYHYGDREVPKHHYKYDYGPGPKYHYKDWYKHNKAEKYGDWYRVKYEDSYYVDDIEIPFLMAEFRHPIPSIGHGVDIKYGQVKPLLKRMILDGFLNNEVMEAVKRWQHDNRHDHIWKQKYMRKVQKNVKKI